MPFPLHSLDYGSLCRLRVLVSPSEAYYLQIAAPHLNGLNPVQKLTPILRYATVSIDNNFKCHRFNKLFARHFPSVSNVPLINEKLYRVDGGFQILSFQSEHNARMIFDQFIIASEFIQFDYCYLTTKFLRDIASHLKTDLTGLIFCKDTFHDAVTMEFICTLFRSLKKLIFTGHFLNNWVDALVTLNYAGMQLLEFNSVSINVLNISETQLIKFFKAQGERFFISIELSEGCNSSEVTQKLDTLFSKRYWRLKEGHEKIIRIRWRGKDDFESRCYQLRNDSHQKCSLI